MCSECSVPELAFENAGLGVPPGPSVAIFWNPATAGT